MSEQILSPSLTRLAQLTLEMSPKTDEYGVADPMIQSVDEKLAKATDLISEAQIILVAKEAQAQQAAATVLADAKVVAVELVARAKVAADVVVEKAAEAADVVLTLAKHVHDTARMVTDDQKNG